MTIRTFAICLYSTAFVAISALAQNPGAAAQNQIGALRESLGRNQAALRSYTWVETTEISSKGEVKKRVQKNCRYGPDGKVEKTPLAGAPSEPAGGGRRRGGVKRAIVEKKVEELKDYMERVGALVQQYVPPDPEKIQAAQQAGNVSLQPAESQGNIVLTFTNYLKSGDSVAIGLDAIAKQVRKYDVHSYLDNPKDDAVTLAVTFGSLPDGTNYAQQTVLDAAGKKIQVKVSNSDYMKVAQ